MSSMNQKQPLLSQNSTPQTGLLPLPTVRLLSYIGWILLTIISKEFSRLLPIHQSKAGKLTFIPARWVYDDIDSRFDNTFLTYGTDYGIAIFMAFATYKCLTASPYTHLHTAILNQHDSSAKSLKLRSAALFLSYATSVLAGGIAHQFFTNVPDSLNTVSFRILWTICVGSVTAAGGFMGMCGSQICRTFHQNNNKDSIMRYHIPVIPDILWIFYGCFMTFSCIMGDISYKRPACDIFVAGTSQFIPTAYCELVLFSISFPPPFSSHRHHNQNDNIKPTIYNMIHPIFRYIFIIGFVLNAPLLPAYPCFVQYSGLSLGVVNALLHLNLTFAWGMQALSLWHFSKAFFYSNVSNDDYDESSKCKCN